MGTSQSQIAFSKPKSFKMKRQGGFLEEEAQTSPKENVNTNYLYKPGSAKGHWDQYQTRN